MTQPNCDESCFLNETKNLLDNYKPREKNDFKYKCHRCIAMKRIITMCEELAVKINKSKTLREEKITLMIEIKNHRSNLSSLIYEETLILQEVNKLFSEEKHCETQEIFNKNRDKLNENIKKHNKIDSKKRKEEKRIVDLEKKIIDNRVEMDLLLDEMIENGKALDDGLEQVNFIRAETLTL